MMNNQLMTLTTPPTLTVHSGLSRLFLKEIKVMKIKTIR